MRPWLVDASVIQESKVEALDFMLTMKHVERAVKWWVKAA